MSNKTFIERHTLLLEAILWMSWTMRFTPPLERLEALCSDIDNVYFNAYTTEKVYVKATLEFGVGNVGKIITLFAPWISNLHNLIGTYGFVIQKMESHMSAQTVMKQIQEAISHVEQMFRKLLKYNIPMVSGDHPEKEDSAILDDSGHQKYLMLLGMLNWV
eukprot:8957278-Ditylum_brightwellii.AAC.1